MKNLILVFLLLAGVAPREALFAASGDSHPVQMDVAVAQRGINAEIWLAARTDSRAGTGAADDPFDASTANKFDAILAGYSGQTNIVVHLLPGSYQTHGCSYYRPSGTGWAMWNGWKIRGAGRDVTTVQWVLPSGSYSYAGADARALGVSFQTGVTTSRGDYCEISDLTVDCNGAALSGSMVSGGILLAGSHSAIERVRVINWRAKGTGVECFVVNVRPEADQTNLTDVTIRDVEVCQPATGTHGGGVTLISEFGCNDSRLQNCYVHDCASTGTDSPTYLNALSVSGSVNVDVSGNRVINCTASSFYHDTGTGSRWSVHDNSFLNVPGGIVISTGAGYITQSAFCNNVITLRDQASPYTKGIWFYCPTTSSSDLRIERNTIAMYGGTTVNDATGIRFEGVTRASVQNNLIDVKTASHAVECHSTAATSITAAGNRTFSGTALPAKAFNASWAAFTTLPALDAADVSGIANVSEVDQATARAGTASSGLMTPRRVKDQARVNTVVLDADMVVTSNTVQATVPMSSSTNHPNGLSVFGFPVAANEAGTWSAKIQLADAGSVDNYKIEITMPSGGSALAAVVFQKSGASSRLTWGLATGGSLSVSGLVGNGGAHILLLDGTFTNGSTAGNLGIKFAQQTSSSSAVTLKAGSSIGPTRDLAH